MPFAPPSAEPKSLSHPRPAVHLRRNRLIARRTQLAGGLTVLVLGLLHGLAGPGKQPRRTSTRPLKSPVASR